MTIGANRDARQHGEAGQGRRGGSSEGLWGGAIRGARRRARIRERRERFGGSRLETVGRARRGVGEAWARRGGDSQAEVKASRDAGLQLRTGGGAEAYGHSVRDGSGET